MVGSAPGDARHVLVVGIDGVRLDSLTKACTPHVEQLSRRGFLLPVQVNQAGRTISGPCWATMLTGVLPLAHGVFDNNLVGHRIGDYPDVLTRCRRAGYTTYAAAGWPPFVTVASGGPLLLGGGLHPGGDPGKDLDAWEVTDEAVTSDACRTLGGPECPTVAVVYLGAPDATAHVLGAGGAYVDAIERSDSRLGRILQTLEGRPTFPSERWTVIVATDHGHRDEGGHGGDSPEERTAWIAAAGASLPQAVPGALEQSDVAAHVLHALDITIAAEWELHGVPFGARG